MKPTVVVVGSLNMDFVVRTSHLPAPGETVLGDDFQMTPGGKGANQAVAAARLGAAVRMIGRVGQDQFGDHLRAALASAGVDVSFVHNYKAKPTGVALIAVDDQGQNQIVVAPGANLGLAPGDVEAMRRLFKGASVALFQLEIPLPTVAAALKLAKEEGLRTILDPAPARHLTSESLLDILRYVDILTPNETEFSGLMKDDCAVVQKLGEQGCHYYGVRESYRVPGFQVEAIDTTGAGDTFNGALAVALAEGSATPDALQFANAAAALSVTRMGAQSSAPTRAEVTRFIADRRSYYRSGTGTE